MAISTYQVQLMMKSADTQTYSQLVKIKDFPDLGGEPELLETTTLSDNMQTYITGIQSLDSMNFTCNYDKTDYDNLEALEGETHDFAVYFGASGENGIFKFTGQLSVYASGGGVNEVVDMIVTIAPSTPITVE